MSNDDDDEAKLPITWERYQHYQLSDDEAATLNRVTAPLIPSVEQAFGSRAEIALANLVGSMLGHMLLGPEGYYVLSTVNDWLEVSARRHGGPELQLKFSDEPSDE